MKKELLLRMIVTLLLLYLGLGALYGGWLLATDPSGEKLGMPLSYIEGTLFSNYLIPGIVLFLVLGVFTIFVLVALWLRLRHYPWLIILQGSTLIDWLTIQLIINSDFYIPYLHLPLYVTAVLLVAGGLLLLGRNGLKRGAGRARKGMPDHE